MTPELKSMHDRDKRGVSAEQLHELEAANVKLKKKISQLTQVCIFSRRR